jgi:hypothetical protein
MVLDGAQTVDLGPQNVADLQEATWLDFGSTAINELVLRVAGGNGARSRRYD